MISNAYCRKCDSPDPLSVVPARLYKDRGRYNLLNEYQEGWRLHCATCGHESQFYLDKEEITSLKYA